MSSEDNISKTQFHGSHVEFKPGDQLRPRNELDDKLSNRMQGRGPSQHGSMVWSTDDRSWAAAHGPHVYEVEHNGLSNRNPGVHGATVSLGATVIRKVKSPPARRP